MVELITHITPLIIINNAKIVKIKIQCSVLLS